VLGLYNYLHDIFCAVQEPVNSAESGAIWGCKKRWAGLSLEEAAARGPFANQLLLLDIWLHLIYYRWH
jgi:hypothetical protein